MKSSRHLVRSTPKTGKMRTRAQPRWKGLVRMQVEYQQPPLKLTEARAVSIKTAYNNSKKAGTPVTNR